MKNKIKLSIALIIIMPILSLLSSLSTVNFFSVTKINNNNYNIIGHRGAAGLAPENTLAAVKIGLQNNVNRIEIDVHQTKDGKVVVMHDKTIDRTTDGSGLIKDYTYSELLKFDAGSWFSEHYKGEKIPLLSDVIQEINKKSELIIEIKYGDDFYPDIIERVISIIKLNNAYKWCIIHSFDTDILDNIHKKDPRIRLHKLFFGKFSFIPLIVDNSIEFYNFDEHDYIEEYSINYHFANNRIINKIHGLGKKINIWTIDDYDEFIKFKKLGIDGFITDFPNKIK